MSTQNIYGTTQIQRYLPELMPQYVLPDERSTRDMIRFIQHIAHFMPYYNEKNEPDGYWGEFFQDLFPADNHGHTWEQLFAPDNNPYTLTGNHPPHQALFIAFLKLFDHARQQLNQLPRRNIDFYYRKLLGFKPRMLKPDTAIVCCTLAPNTPDFVISPQTLFAAPQPGAPELLYQPLDKTVLNHAGIQALKTLFLDKNNTLPHAGTLAQTADDLAKCQDLQKGSAWTLFGNNQNPKANLGFALASPVLQLSGGNRTITVTLLLANTLDYFNPLVKRIQQNPLAISLTTEKEWVNIADKNIEATLLQNPLAISLTTEKEWVNIADKNIEATLLVIPVIDEQEKEMGIKTKVLIQFTLPNDFPPFENYTEEAHQCQYSTAYPVLQCLVNEEGWKHYPVLRHLQIQGIQLHAEVKDFDNLILQNDLGVLDATKPIAVFGAEPVLGANFYIGSHEVFSKKLESLNVNIEWRGLPDSFKQHYKGYKDLSDQPWEKTIKEFKVKTALLNKAEWEDDKEENLFGELEDADQKREKNSSAISILKEATTQDGTKKPFNAYPQLPQFDRYTQQLNRGFLRLTLSNPPYAFGHGLYTHVYTATVIELGKLANVKIEGSAVDTSQMKQDLFKDIIGKIKDGVDSADKNNSLPFFSSLKQTIDDIVNMVNDFFGTNAKTVYLLTNANKDELNKLKEINDKLNQISANLNNNAREEFMNEIKNFNNSEINLCMPKENATDDDWAQAINNMKLKVLTQTMKLEVLTQMFNILEKLQDKNINDVPIINKTLKDELNKFIEGITINNIDAKSASIPQKPYTPTADKISIDYTAVDTVFFAPSKVQPPKTPSHTTCLHLHPFGFETYSAGNHEEEIEKSVAALSNYCKEDKQPLLIPSYKEEEGSSMYIAITKAQTQQNITLYFHFEPYTAENLDTEIPKPEWRYLSNNQWKPLGLHLLSDGTKGFSQSGIVTLQLPHDATANNTLLLPSGNFWLSVSVKKDAATFNKLRYIQTNAVAVQLQMPAHAATPPPHLAEGLPPQSIKFLAVRQAGITEVLQPFSSYGGAAPETDEHFYVRVSERLRYKNRCVQVWDAEHWILENFPQIWAVKCTDNGYQRQIVCAPYPHTNQPYQPLCPYALRRQIESAVATVSSPLMEIAVVNPVYAFVGVTCKVAFTPNADLNYSERQLKQFVAGYLSPFNEKRAPRVNAFRRVTDLQTTERELLLNELVQLDYVQEVKDLVIAAYKDTDLKQELTDDDLCALPQILTISRFHTNNNNIILKSHQTEKIVQDGIEYLATIERNLLVQ